MVSLKPENIEPLRILKKKSSQNLYLQTGKLDPESTPKLLKISMFRKFEINSLKTLDQ